MWGEEQAAPRRQDEEHLVNGILKRVAKGRGKGIKEGRAKIDRSDSRTPKDHRGVNSAWKGRGRGRSVLPFIGRYVTTGTGIRRYT